MSAQLLPNGRQQFTDQNGNPLVSGLVYFYIPNTTTPKNTWQDAGETILNSNPIILDARGQATIFGSGDYRQILQDSAGNTIWDKIVSSPTIAATESAPGIAEIATQAETDAGTDDGTIVTPKKLTSWFTTGLNFLQAGIGAVARAIRDKMRERISVDDFGAKGDGITDDWAAIQAAIEALPSTGGTLYFPKSIYTFGTALDLDSKIGVRLVGTAGGASGGASIGTSLQYTGSGTSGFNFTSSVGCSIEGCHIGYTNAAFAGTLIDASGTSVSPTEFFSLRNCTIADLDGGTAAQLLLLDDALECVFEGCLFTGGTFNVNGVSISAHFSNVMTFINCQFYNSVTAAIASPGDAWNFLGCTFEQTAGNASGALAGGSNADIRGLNVIGCWFGDTTGNGTWINLSNVFGFNFKGNFISGDGAHSVTGIEISSGSAGVSITGNFFNELAIAISFDDATNGVQVSGNTFNACPTKISGQNNIVDGALSGNNPTLIAEVINSPGYVVNGNGLIEQWGSASVTEGVGLAITFPIAFTTLFAVTVTLSNPSGGANTVYVSSTGATGFTANVAGTAGANGVFWRALGK